MKEFQGRRRRFNYFWLVSILLAILIILLVKPVYQLSQKNRLVSAERQSLLEEVAELKVRQAKLAVEVDRLVTDRGVEEEIREKFNVVKTGEKVISLVVPPASTSLATPIISKPWWQIFLDWFKFK